MYWMWYLCEGVTAFPLGLHFFVFSFQMCNILSLASFLLLLFQVCPFDAIQIINLPSDLDKETTHRYGPNSFKLHRYKILFLILTT